jgi:hypothetical protein
LGLGWGWGFGRGLGVGVELEVVACGVELVAGSRVRQEVKVQHEGCVVEERGQQQ